MTRTFRNIYVIGFRSVVGQIVREALYLGRRFSQATIQVLHLEDLGRYDSYSLSYDCVYLKDDVDS